VIDERYKDAADFDKKDVRDRLEISNSVVKVCRTSQSFGISVKVFEKKNTKWDDTRKLMQLAQDESPAQTYSQGNSPLLPTSIMDVSRLSSGRL
jgi:hypothetical protein